MVAELARIAVARGASGDADGIMLARLAGDSGAGSDLLIFTGDGSARDGNTFGRWPDLIDYLSALQVAQSVLKPRIRFKQNFTVPLDGMPATGWPMAMATWESPLANTGAVIVTIPPGVTIDMLQGIGFGLGVACAPRADGETFKWSQFAPGTAPWILYLQDGATITNQSVNALVATPGQPTQTYFVFAPNGATWLAPLDGPIVRANGSDVVIGSQVVVGYQGIPDGWADSASPTALLLYQNSISSTFPALTWAGGIVEMFNGTDSLQLKQRNGTLADRALLAALPGGYALKIGTTYFATDLGANGAPLWWNGSAWVDATGAIVP